jgi:hypothetical protein
VICSRHDPTTGIKIALLAVVLVVCGRSQRADSQTAWQDSAGSFNGRYWTAIPKASESDKTTFLMGFVQGLKYAAGLADQLDALAGLPTDDEHKRFHVMMAASWPGNLTVADVISTLDHFYDVPENRDIVIAGALSIAAMRAAGQSESQVQKEIQRYRTLSR